MDILNLPGWTVLQRVEREHKRPRGRPLKLRSNRRPPASAADDGRE